MRRLGVHTSIAGGLHLSLTRAHALKCGTMQIFSHNPRGWAVKAISEEEAGRFKMLRAELDISPVYIHASYLINMASKDALLRKKSIDLLSVELCRADVIGADYDIGTGKGVIRMADELEKYIGIDKVKLIHLNDSKGAAGSGLDRHEHIGCGKIGVKGLRRFINHGPFLNIPLILETPKKKKSDDPENIAKTRKMMNAQ